MNSYQERVNAIKDKHLVAGEPFALVSIDDLSFLFMYLEHLELKNRKPWEVKS